MKNAHILILMLIFVAVTLSGCGSRVDQCKKILDRLQDGEISDDELLKYKSSNDNNANKYLLDCNKFKKYRAEIHLTDGVTDYGANSVLVIRTFKFYDEQGKYVGIESVHCSYGEVAPPSADKKYRGKSFYGFTLYF